MKNVDIKMLNDVLCMGNVMFIFFVVVKIFFREFLDYFLDYNFIYNEGCKQKFCWNCKFGGVKYEFGNMIIICYYC